MQTTFIFCIKTLPTARFFLYQCSGCGFGCFYVALLEHFVELFGGYADFSKSLVSSSSRELFSEAVRRRFNLEVSIASVGA